MTKKQILRCISFLLVVGLLLFRLCDLFELESYNQINRRYRTYTTLEKGTVDAAIIGTSGIHSYWVSSQAYEEYGMTVYPLSIDSFPAWLYVDVIKDALKYQDLELVVIDIRPFGQVNDDVSKMEVRTRYVLDAMSPFSVNRLSAAFKSMEIMRKVDNTLPRFDLSYLLSVLKYHDKWDDEDFTIIGNLYPYESRFAGFYTNDKLTVKKVTQKPKAYDSSYKKELDPLTSDSLYELLDFLKEENINALFLDTPQIRSKAEVGYANTVYEILDTYDMPYVHYYTEDNKNGISIDFDYKNDFYNSAHTNYYGATKFTAEFSKYLKENYELKDRRNNETAKKYWNGINNSLKEQIKKYEKKKNK